MDIQKMAYQVGLIAAGVIVAGFALSFFGGTGGLLQSAQSGFTGQ